MSHNRSFAKEQAMEAHRWPNDKRIAIIVSVLFESWSEGKHPTYFPRTTPLKPGATDLSASRWSEYGGNEGIWRLANALSERGLPATVFCNALSAERYPDAVRHIVGCNLDVAGHGYAQDQYLLDYPPDEQRGLIRKSLDVLERACGTRPEGWVTPVYGNDRHTTPLLVEEGVKWHCDALDRSLPQIERTAAGPIVAIPWSEFVDNRVQRLNPRAYYEVYADTFDYLYAREHGALLHLAIHAHFGGRPLVSAMLHRVLDHFGGCAGVWFARHSEIARCTAEQQLDPSMLAAYLRR
jgi:peptidoglycan/xylan/chitin deacetylase (PgdA/CDA1 family)